MSTIQFPSSQKGKFQCTAPACFKLFKSLKDMKHHKITDTENHDYCRFCDLDFEEWELLHDHRVQVDADELDDNHIVCRHCGVLFKTREVRDTHVQKRHLPYQCLECLACSNMFMSAADFIRHIEFNKCSLDLRHLKGQIIQKSIVHDMLNKSATYGVAGSGYDDDDNVSGGVSLLEHDLEATHISHPTLEPSSANSGSRVSMSRVGTLGGVLSPGSTTEINTSLTKVPLIWGNDSAKVLFPDAKPTPASQEFVTVTENQPNLLHHQLWNPESGLYQASAFYNGILERYVCPFTVCRSQFRTATQLTQHIRGDHSSVEIKCPLCFMRFSHLYKIMLHMENGPNKCKLIYSDHLQELVDKFSGGLLSAKISLRDDVRAVEFLDFSINKINFERLMGPRTTVVGSGGGSQPSRYALG